jgi:hypothetical protein
MYFTFFQLVETVNTPGDFTCLIGPVVKLLPSHNISVKKTAYSVLPRYIKEHHNELSDNGHTVDCTEQHCRALIM